MATIPKVYTGKYPCEFEIVKQSPVRWQVRMIVGPQSFSIGPLVETEFDAQWMRNMFINALLNIESIPKTFSDQEGTP